MVKRAISGFSLVAISICLIGSAWNGCEDGTDKNEGRFTAEKRPKEIVNGVETGYKEFKGVIAVVIGGGVCSGTLIDPNVVVTAGHCVYRPSDSLDAVADPSGIDILGGTGSTMIFYSTVTEAVKHPLWEGNSGDDPKADIAMLHLRNAVTKVDPTVEHYGVRKEPPIENGEKAMLVGYGRPNPDGVSGVHRKGETTVWNKNLLSDAFEVGDPSGTCSGDSGGACLTQTKGGDWQLAGVISASAGGCPSANQNMMINVMTYYDWIDATMIDFVGYGLDGPPDTDTETATDTDTDTDTDADTDSSEVDADDDDDNDNDNDDSDAGENDKDDDKSGCGCRAAGELGNDSLAAVFLRLFSQI